MKTGTDNAIAIRRAALSRSWAFAGFGGAPLAGHGAHRLASGTAYQPARLMQAEFFQAGPHHAPSAPGMVGVVAALAAALALIVVLLIAEIVSKRKLEAALTQERTEHDKHADGLRSSADQYRLIVETTQEGVWVIDRNGRTTYVNARMVEMLGFSEAEILGRRHTDFMDAEGRAIAEDNMRRRKEGIAEEQDFRFIRKNGSPLWARVVTNPMTDPHGIYIGTLTMVTDITRRKNVEDALELHDSAITASSNGIVIVDARREDMPIVTVNPAFEEITGYKASEVVGKPPFMLEGEDRAHRSLSALHLALRQGRDVHVESRNKRKDGVEYWNELFVAPIRNKQGTLTHFVAIQNDITARRNAVEALQRAREELEQKVLERTAELQKIATDLQHANELLTTLATEDGLTGLKNRRVFQERLDQEVQRSIRYGLPLSLMLLDVDHFKLYNDRFGHPAGDEVLKTVGEILMQSARATDLVARYGGEEFAVIMINTDQDNSTVLAERVRQSIEQTKWDLRQITASIGVATLGLDVAAPLEFVRAADAALYHAKRNGRNVVVCHHEIDDGKPEAPHPLAGHADPLPGLPPQEIRK